MYCLDDQVMVIDSPINQVNGYRFTYTLEELKN